MLKIYLILLLAVLCEGVGSTCLQASQQFTRFWPSVGVVAGFGSRGGWKWNEGQREDTRRLTCNLAHGT